MPFLITIILKNPHPSKKKECEGRKNNYLAMESYEQGLFSSKQSLFSSKQSLFSSEQSLFRTFSSEATTFMVGY